MKSILKQTSASLVFVLVLLSSVTAYANKSNLVMATATTGGTYYPVGVAISTLISIKLAQEHGITATAINSAGSGENIQMIKKGEAELAILQALFGLEAYSGKGFYEGKPERSFLSISMLWRNVEHFAVNKRYAPNSNIKDYSGMTKKFSIGLRGSGTEGSGIAILSSLGLDLDSMKLEYLGYNPSVDAMLDGRIGGANIPAGAPASAITQLYARGKGNYTVLNFSDEDIANVQKTYPIWNKFVIKAGTYPGQKEDITTIAQPNVLVVSTDLSDNTVYLITKTMYENLDFLQNIHSATKDMKIEEAVTGLPTPLHPGAEKYYKEIGLNIPPNLTLK